MLAAKEKKRKKKKESVVTTSAVEVLERPHPMHKSHAQNFLI